jgi:hypothetical protein
LTTLGTERSIRKMAPLDRLDDTYVAALQHDLVDVPDAATLVGVVRRPTGWFNSTVDENYPALGPPEPLLEDVKQRQTDHEAAGMSDDDAHNTAWDDVEFADRYRAHLADSSAAQDAVSELADRLRDGEHLVLVCFENTEQKRCHRTILRDHLAAQL